MKPRCLITFSSDGFELFHSNGKQDSLSLEEETSVRDRAEQLVLLLRERKAVGSELIFGIDSRSVYFVEAPDELPGGQNIDAIKFEIESHLPVDAEDMSLLVLDSTDQKRVLVWDMRSCRELLHELNTEHGISFAAFVPMELFLLEYLQRQNLIGRAGMFASLTELSTQRIFLNDGVLFGWEFLSGFDAESAKLANCVLVDTTSELESESVLPDSRDSMLLKAVADRSRATNSRYNFLETVDQELKNSQPVWQPLLLATLLFLLCAAGALGYRAHSLQKNRQLIEAQMTAEFKSLFPNKRINGAVVSLLETELKKQKKINTLISHAESSGRLLENLRGVLAGVPTKFRFQFDTIELREASVDITGEVKDFDDFQSLKQAYIEQGFSIGNNSRYGTPFTLVLESDQKLTTDNQTVQVSGRAQ